MHALRYRWYTFCCIHLLYKIMFFLNMNIILLLMWSNRPLFAGVFNGDFPRRGLPLLGCCPSSRISLRFPACLVLTSGKQQLKWMKTFEAVRFSQSPRAEAPAATPASCVASPASPAWPPSGWGWVVGVSGWRSLFR